MAVRITLSSKWQRSYAIYSHKAVKLQNDSSSLTLTSLFEPLRYIHRCLIDVPSNLSFLLAFLQSDVFNVAASSPGRWRLGIAWYSFLQKLQC